MRRLRIGINLTPLRSGQIGGSETYVRGLLKALSGTGHEWVLFVGHRNHAVEFASNACEIVSHSYGEATRAEPGLLARVGRGMRHLRGQPLIASTADAAWQAELVRRYRLDVWFDPLTALPPMDLGCATVLTVQDIQHEAFPGFFSPTELVRRARVYQPACAAATRVLVPSDFVKRTLIDSYHLNPERVTAVQLAAPEISQPEQGGLNQDEKVLAAYGIRGDYALYPAATWPHKNHVRLVEAFRLARRTDAYDLQLVLTGQSFGAESELLLNAKDLLHDGSVVRLGHIPREHVTALYRRAHCLVFPSLYEGFGIPILEAMQVGVPVLASRFGSIPEVGGEAVLYVDAEDAYSVAEAMLQLQRDENLRRDLRRRGFERVARFSYARCASESLAVIEDAWRQYRAQPRSGRVRAYVGRRNLVYDGVQLDFRCPRAKSLSLSLSPCDTAEPYEVEVRVNDARLGVLCLGAKLTAGRLAGRIQARDDELVRVSFRVRSRAPWGRRLCRLPRPPVCRIEALTVSQEDSQTFELITPGDRDA